MNVVMLADGGLVETQATAEQNSYSRQQLNEMLDYAEKASANSSPPSAPSSTSPTKSTTRHQPQRSNHPIPDRILRQ